MVENITKLSSHDEKSLVIRAQRGDEEAMEALRVVFKPLVDKVIFKTQEFLLPLSPIALDDLRNKADELINVCIQNVDTSCYNKPSTYIVNLLNVKLRRYAVHHAFPGITEGAVLAILKFFNEQHLSITGLAVCLTERIHQEHLPGYYFDAESVEQYIRDYLTNNKSYK